MLSKQEAHLWFVRQEKVYESKLLQEYRRLLSQDELMREKKFHFDADRKRYLISRALVRSVLSKYSDVEPQDWEFLTEKNGKPKINPKVHCASGHLQFNLSHSESFIVLAVTSDRSVGIDVEARLNKVLDCNHLKLV